ncbi:hypothetical protein GCM10017612_29100 [Novosphingobium resinovorum]|nr:hypothetical protein GCM10017612_29100 [Novosphingobium resinovorum]
MMGLLRLAVIGTVGVALYRYAGSKFRITSNDRPPVRDAGPENMTSPPQSWSRTDEAIDESFPASDPPSNY